MGPGSRTLEHLDCPECGAPTPVKLQGGDNALVFLYCPACMPRCLVIGKDLPGLPSDLTYLRAEGPRLLKEAMEPIRAEIKARRKANAKAEALLNQHLSPQQLDSFANHQWFDVPSRYTDQLSYRVAVEEYRASVFIVGTTGGGFEHFVAGTRKVPGIGSSIRNAAEETFRKKGAVRLCLSVLGTWLPHADCALTFKLFAEADEVRLWVKGTRIYVGLRPEVIDFTEMAS